MQKINALPDVNREDVIPEVTGYIPSKDIGGDVRYSDMDRNTALPDENQSRVLPRVQISTGNPDMPNGRSEMIKKDGVTGNIPQPGTGFAVGPQPENIKKSTQYLQDDTNDGPKQNSL